MIKAIKRWMFVDSHKVLRRDLDLEARYKAELELIQDGWMPWFSPIGPHPWDYELIKIRRPDTQVTVMAYKDIPKEMNGTGLYWRPWYGATLDGREAA